MIRKWSASSSSSSSSTSSVVPSTTTSTSGGSHLPSNNQNQNNNNNQTTQKNNHYDPTVHLSSGQNHRVSFQRIEEPGLALFLHPSSLIMAHRTDYCHICCSHVDNYDRGSKKSGGQIACKACRAELAKKEQLENGGAGGAGGGGGAIAHRGEVGAEDYCRADAVQFVGGPRAQSFITRESGGKSVIEAMRENDDHYNQAYDTSNQDVLNNSAWNTGGKKKNNNEQGRGRGGRRGGAVRGGRGRGAMTTATSPASPKINESGHCGGCRRKSFSYLVGQPIDVICKSCVKYGVQWNNMAANKYRGAENNNNNNESGSEDVDQQGGTAGGGAAGGGGDTNISGHCPSCNSYCTYLIGRPIEGFVCANCEEGI